MKTLEEIRHALKDRRLSAVAAATGYHPTTLARVRDGHAEPSLGLFMALLAYFEARP